MNVPTNVLLARLVFGMADRSPTRRDAGVSQAGITGEPSCLIDRCELDQKSKSRLDSSSEVDQATLRGIQRQRYA